MSEDFGAVDRRPLVAVLAANLVSVVGNCLTYMGVPWFVLQSTGSAAKAGVVAFCTLLPAVLAALVSGPVIDRTGRRRVSVASDLACGAAVAAVPLLRFAGVLQFWMLCVLMAMTGLFRAPGETARSVLLPTLAGRAGMPLTRAAGLYDGAARCAALTASALGGVLIAVLGAADVLLVDAATFAVAAPLFAYGVRGLPEARAQRGAGPGSLRAYRRELADGYRFVAATPLLLGLCLMTLVTRGLDQAWSAVLLPADARAELGGAVDLGLLNAAFGVCALAGALVYGAVGSRLGGGPCSRSPFSSGACRASRWPPSPTRSRRWRWSWLLRASPSAYSTRSRPRSRTRRCRRNCSAACWAQRQPRCSWSPRWPDWRRASSWTRPASPPRCWRPAVCICSPRSARWSSRRGA